MKAMIAISKNVIGNGSTCVACINTNRKYIGIEKDKHYFEVATNRIKECIKEGDA